MPLKTKGLKPGSVGKQTFQVYIPGVGWRTISAFVRADGSFDIIPPKRPATPLPPTAPVVNSTVPNPRILNKVKPIARNLVMNAGRAGDPEPYCFGIQYARPIIVGADDDGERLVLDMLWSVGEIGGLSGGSSYQIWMPDIGVKSVPAGSLHEHFVGTAGQSASTIMTALKGSYDALPNKAHSVITMQAGWNLNVLGVIWGVKCFDPRPSPQVTAHTENPALILADVFTRCGYTVDWDSVADAADWADGLLTSPNLQRSKIGGQIRDRQSLSTYVTALANYAGCYVDVRGGSVIFVADKPRSSTHTVTTEDIVAGSERLNLRGSRNAPELVGVTYLLGSNNPATAYFGASGGSGTESSLNMPFFDSQAVAGLKAKEVYNKGQNAIESLEFVSWDDGLIRTVGDVGTITLPSVGLSSQLMALEENEPIQRGRWRRRYVEYDVDNYPLDTTGIYGGNGNQTLYNPYFPPDGPQPTLTIEAAPESPEWDRIKIEFPNELWAYLKDFYVTVTTTADTETILYSEYIDPLSSTVSPQVHTTYTDFVAVTATSPLTVYRVNVYVRSIVDALSETPGTADVPDSYITTAKHWGDGSSPENHYRTGGGSVIGDSPQNWNALLPSSVGAINYNKMTLVFCVNVQSLAGVTGYNALFTSEAYSFYIYVKDDGTLMIRAEDNLGSAHTIEIDNTASPQPNPVPLDTWRAFMLSIDNDGGASPLYVHFDLYAADVGVPGSPTQLFSGVPGPSARASMRPHSYSGYVWAAYDGFDGDPALDCYVSYIWCGEEYVDPSTNWGDFFDANNKPIDLGADGSGATGRVPESFFPDGDLSNNRGSGLDWDEFGTVPAAPSSPTD